MPNKKKEMLAAEDVATGSVTEDSIKSNFAALLKRKKRDVERCMLLLTSFISAIHNFNTWAKIMNKNCLDH